MKSGLVIKRALMAGLLLFADMGSASVVRADNNADFENNKARVVGYRLRQELPREHYSHKPLDDNLSHAAFDLYLKQLDYQKRFLLEDDVRKLRPYADKIDDEINLGDIELPQTAHKILSKRLALVTEMVRAILASDFDFSGKDDIETDPEKLSFCKTDDELRERWRRNLKYQVLIRVLNMEDDEAATPKGDKKEENGAEPKKDNGDGKPPRSVQERAREKVLKSHEEAFARMRKAPLQDQYDQYFNAVTRAYDPHTNYMPPEKKEDFDISMRGSLEGIGALLSEEGGYIKVSRVIPGSAAARQGQLAAEDIILRVAEKGGEPVEITDMRLRDAVKLIRGKKGTEVRLTVKKPDGILTVIPIIRDVVQIEETFVKGTVITDDKTGGKYGYIKIPSFYRDFEQSSRGGKARNSTDDLKAELDKLLKEKIHGLVLDLRNNGGGALSDSISIAGLFIKSGPVVQVKDSYGNMKTLADDDPSLAYDGPMVVLVNKFSASASEILAGALQDYGRAVIIGGEHTHGKGTVQTILDLDSKLHYKNMDRFKPLGALKITIQKFYRVTGESTQFRGVVPDIVLPDSFQYLKTGEQYGEYALPWDTVGGAAYTKWKKRPSLARIKEKSAARTSSNSEFAEVTREAARVKDRSEHTIQSLNMADVRKEREDERKAAKSGAKFHGLGDPDDQDDSGKPSGKAQTEEEKQAAWLKGLKEDPYLGESIAVINDIGYEDNGEAATLGQKL
ncbi:MAG: carboxy terminal-processing peptidase [Nitrospirae bacterium]|nr:carboxy terminal-processing peptidase [Nitrospirota bacterium]